MKQEEIIAFLGLTDKVVKVRIINPVRKGDMYLQGEVAGFKSGIYGGGGSRYKDGIAQSFSSLKMRWIKKPKIFVAYDFFTYGKSQHTDWVDIDNCDFFIEEKK